MNGGHKSNKHVAPQKGEQSFTETKGGGIKAKTDVTLKDWDKGRSEITQSWVIPAPNRTICHIWDALPVGLDDVLNHLDPNSGGDLKNVTPPATALENRQLSS